MRHLFLRLQRVCSLPGTILDFLFLCSVLLAFQACVLSSCLISTAAVPVQACSLFFSWLSGGTWGIYTCTKKDRKKETANFKILVFSKQTKMKNGDDEKINNFAM